MKPAAVEFLVHMSLAAGVASVNSLLEDSLVDRGEPVSSRNAHSSSRNIDGRPTLGQSIPSTLSHSEHIPHSRSMVRPLRYNQQFSVTGGRLDLQWRQLRHVEYLTDGGNSWIHTAMLDGRPVVVKTLKPECQDVALAINEIESELCKFPWFLTNSGHCRRSAHPVASLTLLSGSCETQSSPHCKSDRSRCYIQGCTLHGPRTP